MATINFILNKNALGAKFQSIYAMKLEEDDLGSWHNILINFLPISSILFFVFEIVFSHCLFHMQKSRQSFPAPVVNSSMASYNQKPLGS